MKAPVDRRQFLATATAAGAALNLATTAAAKETPALLGGTPVRREPFPGWPRVDDQDEKGMIEVLRSGHWYRGAGDVVNQFEAAYAELTGAKHCVAVANGTSSLITSLAALGVGPGDEVIVPPYTFIATVNAVLLHHALPVFVDTDPETFQINARKIEAAITDRTAAIMPVHLGGSVADLDAILEVARKHKLPVVEDACQSHLAEWRNRKVGTWGSAGGFSFQNSKNLTSGEGGAILTNDGELAERCYKFQDNSSGRRGSGDHASLLGGRGANLRLTEFQGACSCPRWLAWNTSRGPASRTPGTSPPCSKRSPESPPRRCTKAARETLTTCTCSGSGGHLGGPASGEVPQGPRRGGDSRLGGLHPAEQAVVPPRCAHLEGVQAPLPEGGPRRVGGTEPVPRQRPGLRGGGLVHAEHAPGRPRGHGADRRGRPEDSGPCREPGPGVTI